MVDLGANSGYYSLHAAKFGASKVLAVEANSLLCDRINFHIHTNGFNSNIVTYNQAVGNANGRAKLALQDGDQGSNFIIRESNMINSGFMEVEMSTLLSIVKESGVNKINVLKIDIEGMEEDVLTSFFSNADKSIWPKSIIMETIKSNLWKFDLEEFLKELGYKIIARTRSNSMMDLL